MTPFTQLTATCFPLASANVDTDQLIPARFMKESRSVGYGQFLLYDQRFNNDGEPIETFALNQSRMSDAGILVAKRNFGAGSSREAAVYALVDYGFRCVIAPSFGDIFASNAVNNGLLPALVSAEDADILLQLCEEVLNAPKTEPPKVSVDLEKQVIRCAGHTASFEVKPAWRTKLLNGWDDIDLTRAYGKSIEQFYTRYQANAPWAAKPQEHNVLAVGR